MSGHSKWSTIKRKKGEIDAARSKVFQKLAKELYVAAKGGDKDPLNNPALRMVVDKAHSSGNSENYEFVRYEGYAPHGVAVMVDCLTDNKNRTAGDVRSTFTKRGGNLGTDGSVSYMFDRKGIIVLPKTYDEDMLMTLALDNDCLDFVVNDDSYEIYTSYEDFIKMNNVLNENNIAEFIMNETRYIPQNYISLNDEDKEKIYNLIETLEDLDDVQDVYHNMEE